MDTVTPSGKIVLKNIYNESLISVSILAIKNHDSCLSTLKFKAPTFQGLRFEIINAKTVLSAETVEKT